MFEQHLSHTAITGTNPTTCRLAELGSQAPADLEVTGPPTRDERGMSTAEYAVGTVAAVSFAGVLIKVLSDPTIQQLLIELIMWIIRTVSGMNN
ncbi:DUF4244 domain-containing protein [Granulicoccus phenolivorans]|uniref:DUF4244 domain-containing protein n=1 Tax=Granulicoccus phenolivorans TaxID=266854 RepID=UPI000407C666|nr:DUF4244 domain-containing protein [Granulicoccus phenolivorans]